MVRRVTRMVWHREYGRDRRVELRGPDVPIRELAFLAGDERVELHGGNQRVCSRRPRRILVEPISAIHLSMYR